MRPSWDETWIEVAKTVAKRSLCESRQVGAVIVDPRKRVVATGYNGPPEGFDHGGKTCSNWCPRQQTRESAEIDHYGMSCPSIHAEANAILYASRQARENSTLYITSLPCADCTKLISNSGIKRCVFVLDRKGLSSKPKEKLDFLRESGIEVDVMRGDFTEGSMDFYRRTLGI